jgi:hypothetical protein
MKGKPVMYKFLVVGVIVLFIGIGIQPAFAIELEQPFNDDCEICPKKVSKQHLILLEILLNKMEKYDNQLSVLSKLNPEVEEKYQEILERITTLQDLDPSNEFCDFLAIFATLLMLPIDILYSIGLIIIPSIFFICFCFLYALWHSLCYEEHL